jgi:phage-related protein
MLSKGENMIEKLEVSLINENVHNFKRGEFGVEKIKINDDKGLIEIIYATKEDGTKRVIIPLQNIEKVDYTEKMEKEQIEKKK